METFQINDEDGYSLGLLTTTLDESDIKKLYDEFCTDDTYSDVQGDIEEFIIFCQDKEPEELFERYFLDGVIYPPDLRYDTFIKSRK